MFTDNIWVKSSESHPHDALKERRSDRSQAVRPGGFDAELLIAGPAAAGPEQMQEHGFDVRGVSAMTEQHVDRRVAGSVDPHKDLHVAAVVDERDQLLGSRSFATTRQGYRQLVAWMRSFGHLERVGVEVLEVTEPDRTDRRRRGKNDGLDAEAAANAAFAG